MAEYRSPYNWVFETHPQWKNNQPGALDHWGFPWGEVVSWRRKAEKFSSLKLSCQICVRWTWKQLMFSVFYLSVSFVSKRAQISNIYIPVSNASKEKWTRVVQDGPLPVLSGATGAPFKWPLEWVAGVITPINGVMGPCLKLVTLGPPFCFCFCMSFTFRKKKYPLNFIAEDKLPTLPMKKVDFRGGGAVYIYLFMYLFIYLFIHLFIYLFIFIFF